MKCLVPLIFLIALGAGQIIRSPSSYDNGVKWEFGVFRDDTLARSSADQGTVVPIVYENKEPVAPMARREPAVATVYKKLPAVPDVYTKSVVPTVYQKQPIVQNAHKRQSAVVPAVFKTQPVASNVYKNQPVVQNVYNLQPPVSTVRKTYPVVPGIYKSQPIGPIVHHQGQHYFPVPKVTIGAQKKTKHHVWNRHDPHRSFGNAHVAHH